MSIEINIRDLAPQAMEEFFEKCDKALEICGLEAERYAKELCPYKTGNLRNSITHQESENEMVIGTNVEYGVYVEMGTGRHVSGGSPPWVYTPDGGKTFYRTEGQIAKPFIKPSIADHTEQYSQIIKSTLKNG